MTNIKEKLNEGWLHVNIIIEILGKPADYIEKVLEAVVDQIGKEKNVEIINKQFHKAKIVEDAKEVFTTFSEVEIIIANMSRLVDIVFDYMPASIEIVEPANVSFKLEDANTMLNDIAAKMHQYDAMTKKFRLEAQFLAKKLEELKGNKTESK